MGRASTRRDERDPGESDHVEDAGLDVARPRLGKRDVGRFVRHKRLQSELALKVQKSSDNLQPAYRLRSALECVENAVPAPQ